MIETLPLPPSQHGEEEQSKKQKHEHGHGHGHHHGAGHKHDDKVTSVGITCPGDLDGAKLNRWVAARCP